MPADSKDLQDIRIQGRWLFNLPGFLIAFPLTLCVFAEGIVKAADSPQTWEWLLVLCASFGCVWLYAVTIAPPAIRFIDARDGDIRWVAIVAGTFGLVLWALTWTLTSLLKISAGTDWVVMFLILVAGGSWWGCLTAYAMQYRDFSSRNRTALIESKIALATNELEQTQILLDIQSELSREVSDELDSSRQQVEALLEKDKVHAEDWRDLSQTLLDAADLSVKPLSRRMWKKSIERYPRTTLFSLVANTIRYQPFRPITLAVIAFGSSAMLSVKELGTATGLTLLCLGLVGFLLITYSGNALMRRFPQAHVAIFLTTFAIIQVETWAVQQIRDSILDDETPIGLFAFRVLASAILVLATSGLGSWFDSRESLERTFRESLREGKIASIARSRQVARLAQEAAQHLHGSLQTRLVSCAMVIERALNAENDSTLHQALVEARSILEAPVSAEEPSLGIRDEIVRKLDLWTGICAFDIFIDIDATSPRGVTTSTVGRLVEEAVANAIRHGGATWVSVDLRADADSRLRLTVSDNGRGPGGGSPGIGTALLGQATEGEWSLTGDKTGSTLEAVLR